MAHFVSTGLNNWFGTIWIQCRRQPPVVVAAVTETGDPSVGRAKVHPAIAIIANGLGVVCVCQPRDCSAHRRIHSARTRMRICMRR